MEKKNKYDFISNANKIHNFKYDYSLVNYVNYKTKVKIICNKHGIFGQNRYIHIVLGRGCPKCGNIQSHITQTYSTDEFVDRAKLTHQDKYDYSLVEYKNDKSKIKIICPIHGVFEQTPFSHLINKSGCRICGIDIITRKVTHTTEVFINNAKKIHGNKYDYSLIDYKNILTKVKIICPKHGVFEQKPNNHTNQKQGCPICKLSKGELKIKHYLDSRYVEYKQQHIFPNCKNIKPLPFDFYLPKYNICIEYDGRLHSHPWERSKSSLEKFKKRILLDEIKNKFCKENNIKLIRIDYKDFSIIDDKINILLINL